MQPLSNALLRAFDVVDLAARRSLVLRTGPAMESLRTAPAMESLIDRPLLCVGERRDRKEGLGR